MNYTTATRTQASNYTRGTTLRTPDQTAHAIRVADWAADEARNAAPVATDADLWTAAMNGLLFLSGDLGPSINA